VTGARERGQIAGTDEQTGTEDGPKAWHRGDDRSLRMILEGGRNLGVEDFDAFVKSKDVGGQFADDRRGKILAWQRDLLSAGGRDGSSCQSVVVAHSAVPQSRRQPCMAESADPVRTRIASQSELSGCPGRQLRYPRTNCRPDRR
jgi:hypothetical protein